jgi:hypothetical protein
MHESATAGDAAVLLPPVVPDINVTSSGSISPRIVAASLQMEGFLATVSMVAGSASVLRPDARFSTPVRKLRASGQKRLASRT